MSNINGSTWNEAAAPIVTGSPHVGRAGRKGAPRGAAMGARTRFTLRALAVGMILSFGDAAHAMPAGGTVTSGAATISSTGGKMTITESTPSVTINWQSFSIGKSEAGRVGIGAGVASTSFCSYFIAKITNLFTLIIVASTTYNYSR